MAVIRVIMNVKLLKKEKKEKNLSIQNILSSKMYLERLFLHELPQAPQRKPGRTDKRPKISSYQEAFYYNQLHSDRGQYRLMFTL